LDEFSANPTSIDEATRQHYAKLYARPGAMHSAFEQFAAFRQDAIDNKALAAKGKLKMPVLAIGAEKSFGTAAFGLLAVTALMVFCALEDRSPWYVLASAFACALASAYGFLQGAWPFAVIEAIFAAVAVRRWDKRVKNA
jgi:hypothetical protein